MPASEYLKLEQRLVLAAWGCHMLGYSSNKAMLEDLREVDEGYESTGRSHLVQRILSRGSKCLVKREDLEQYDANVRSHLAYFNQHREEALTLRYFQHLSLLISELFLDWRFNHKNTLRKELNDFLYQHNIRRAPTDPRDTEFKDADLNKLAFWMATGSGKTILMHFHYRQFLHYNQEPL
ncbi:MAG: restriction endonuclease subunit R, partial [Terriglobia bacterium]